jgi:hypothetical protein
MAIGDTHLGPGWVARMDQPTLWEPRLVTLTTECGIQPRRRLRVRRGQNFDQ